ncbi:unnamed protein product [Ectocarpus sp. 4 AP-2014]
MSEGEPAEPCHGVVHPVAATHEGNAAAEDEDRRVMALASELRISSSMTPRELVSLRTTTPLESNDELEDDEEEEKEEGRDQEEPSNRGGRTGFFLDSTGATAVLPPPSSSAPGRGAAAAIVATPAVLSSVRRRPRRRRQRGNDGGDAGGVSDSSSSSNGNTAASGGATARSFRLRGGGGSGKSSTGFSGTSSSATTGGDDDDADSWMRSPTGGGNGGVELKNGIASSSLRFLGGGGPGGAAGAAGGGIFSEDTASSSSATLSLQLPFSEDEAALLNVLGQTFHPPANGGGGGGGGALGGLAALQRRRSLLEGLGLELPGGEAAVRARVLGLQEELVHLERRRGSLEGDLRQERARHESQVQSLEKRWLEQVAALKKGQEMAEIERDTLEARLRDKKDMYEDLALSDALARELRRVPVEKQTVKEYVSLKAYDLVASSKAELERTRRELEKTQEQLLATTEAAELQHREDARARRLATAREEGLKVDLEALRERAEEMGGRAREAQRAADENSDKARGFDEVEALLRTTRLELDAARALSKSQAVALVEVAESEKAAARTAQDASQRSLMLEMDKTYLQREARGTNNARHFLFSHLIDLSEAQNKADRLGRESEAVNERLRDLERSKDTLAAELVSVRERTRSEHEERLEAEVGRLREQSAKELADIRASGREVYERENETLREARKDALQDLSRVRSELNELQRAHEDLVITMAKSNAAHETAVGEVRSELRLKSFELSQLGVAHAEKCSSLRQAGLEVDMLKEQVAVHRAEFAELEASTTRKASELQLLLVGERDKVRAFEDLELEVDGAVMRTGREMLLEEYGENGAGKERGQEDGEHRVSNLSPQQAASPLQSASGGLAALPGGPSVSAGGGRAAIPMAPHRRLRQAVLLAHKLLRKERELEVARRELTEVQSRVASWESRAVRAEGLLESVEQPTKYMIDSIRAKDSEIEGLRAAQQRLVAKAEALERACR